MTGLRNLTLVLAALALALGAGAASAQSLADLAKKEKERREKTPDAGRVITERELSSRYGGLPATSVSGAASADAAEGEGSGEAAESEEGEQEDETKTEAYWQGRVKVTKDKIATLEQRLATEDWGEGQRANVDPRGLNNLTRRQQTEQDLAAARAELAAIREEARRAGVPPGWVR